MKYLRAFVRSDRWPKKKPSPVPDVPITKRAVLSWSSDPEWGWMTKQKFNINFCKLCDTFLDVEPSLFTATLFVQLYWELLLRKLLHYRHFCACVSWKWKGSRHFRVTQGLCIKCSTFDLKVIFHSHANKTHFHKKGFALGLILKVRDLRTRKGPISSKHILKKFYSSQQHSLLYRLRFWFRAWSRNSYGNVQSIDEIGYVSPLDDHWSFNLGLLTPLLTVWLKSSHKKMASCSKFNMVDLWCQVIINRVVTRYIFSSLIPIFCSKFWSLIPKCSKIWSLIPRKFYDPMIERCHQLMFPRRRLSFINNN